MEKLGSHGTQVGHLWLHFTDEETEENEVKHLLQFTQQACGASI